MWADLETRSLCNLKVWGGRTYAAHQSTEVICGSLKITPSSPKIRWQHVNKECEAYYPHGQLPLAALEAFATAKSTGRPVTFHNADGFDRHVFERWYPGIITGGRATGLTAYRDSMHFARFAGMPASLEELCQFALGCGKDERGAALIKAFCIPISPSKPKLRHIPEPALLDMMGYCDRDVDLLCEVDCEYLEEVERNIPAWEKRNIEYSRYQNEHGIKFDVPLAQAIIEANAEFCARLRKRIPLITDGRLKEDDLSSPQKVLRYLQANGLNPTDPMTKKPSIAKKVLEAILELEDELGGEDEDESTTGTDDGGALGGEPPVPGNPTWVDDDSWDPSERDGGADTDAAESAIPRVHPSVFDVCRARLGVSRITTGKLHTGIGSADHAGIIRDGIVLAGSHTLRYAGRRFQLLNLPRGEVDEQAIDEAREILEATV